MGSPQGACVLACGFNGVLLLSLCLLGISARASRSVAKPFLIFRGDSGNDIFPTASIPMSAELRQARTALRWSKS